MKIVRFEEIEGWKAGRVLCRMVYQMSGHGRFKDDFGLRDQMRRAAISIVSNIAEGFESGSNSEFRRFLRYARRSAAEVKSQAYVALDESYIGKDQFDSLAAQSDKVGMLINGFLRFLSSRARQKPSKPIENEPRNGQTNRRATSQRLNS